MRRAAVTPPGRISLFGEPEVRAERVVHYPSLRALLGTLYVTAVLINYLWEVPQMALYEWWGASWAVGLLVCLQAALGDGLLVLALYGLGCAIFRRRDWILQPGVAGYALLVLSGMVAAVVVEVNALAWNRWAYNALMPLIPGLGVGLVPVAQMMVLPPLIARLSGWWLLRTRPGAGRMGLRRSLSGRFDADRQGQYKDRKKRGLAIY